MTRFAEVDTDAVVRLVRSLKDDLDKAEKRIADLEHTITQYLDSHGTAGTGVLGKRLADAVGGHTPVKPCACPSCRQAEYSVEGP